MSARDNSYPVFSEVLEADDPSEHDWLVKVASRLWGVPGGDDVQEWPEKAEMLLSTGCFDDVFGLMPKWKPLKRKKGILIYSDDGCNVHAVPPLVQLYLNRFHSDWYWFMEWAEICETPSPSGFRGGAVFITDQHVAWHFTTHWINNMIESIEIQFGGHDDCTEDY